MENFEFDLTCPITLELFEDPISVPCCGKSFSRNALINVNDCPLCRGDLTNFDVRTAPKNIIISSLVESFIQSKPKEIDVKKHQWNATIVPICHNQIFKINLELRNSQFKIKPSLLILVVDKSGSMSGNPWRQTQSALIHIMNFKRSYPNLIIRLIVYDSCATIIDLSGSIDDAIRQIQIINAGGGTNFMSAFSKIGRVLADYISSPRPEDQSKLNNINNASIVFLTDGQDGSNNKSLLVPSLQNHIIMSKIPHIYIHTIGFSNECDKDLLEGIRKAGTLEGIFRYAEPGDDIDVLCNKIMCIFDICTRTSTIELDIKMNDQSYKHQMSIDTNNNGSLSFWVNQIPSVFEINTPLEKNIMVKLDLIEDSNGEIYQEWLNGLVDETANTLLNIVQSTLSKDIKQLELAIISHKLNFLTSKSNSDRPQRLIDQLNAFKKNSNINIGKLSEMRFDSMFQNKIQPIQSTQSTQSTQPTFHNSIQFKPYVEEPIGSYGTSSLNWLQQEIINYPTDELNSYILHQLNNAELDDITYVDELGNNAIMIAAYKGHSKIIDNLLSRFAIDLNQTNSDGETAVTIAIKKRGYHKSLDVLLQHGGQIIRSSSLEKFALDKHHTVTAEMIVRNSTGTELDETMSNNYLKFMIDKVINNPQLQFDSETYTKLVLKNRFTNQLVGLCKIGCKITIDLFLEYCIPPKPDDPMTNIYLELANTALTFFPDLINQSNSNGETPLFVAAEKGSLPHVKLFLEKGSKINQANNLGNSPLWISCFKRYPCIIQELLNSKADINQTNLKGNPPLYCVCQRGPKKIAEILLSKNPNLKFINNNGDTLILLCCRNGQHDLLELFLNYVDEEFVNHKAQIDGFNAIFASVEADRPGCINVLNSYGISLEQKTDPDNKILPSATPLHLAAYYGRELALNELIKIGVNINSLDINGQTPLHLAVIQSNAKIVRSLINNKADLNIRDKMGLIPISYSRNNNEIEEILINPLDYPLLRLARGSFSKDDEILACKILESKTNLKGCMTSHDFVSPKILTESVICSNLNVTNTLIKLTDRSDAVIWAQWIKNPRILKLFEPFDPNSKELLLLENSALDPFNSYCLFLGSKPKFESDSDSGLFNRMENINLVIDNNWLELTFNKSQIDFNCPNDLTWNSKVFTINKVKSGENLLSAHEVFMLNLYSSNQIFNKMIHNILDRSYMKYLYDILMKLPLFNGEVFIGSDHVNRSNYQVGTNIKFTSFVSGTTLWRIATQNAKDFVEKNKGTVFIIKSKTGKFISNYSACPFDVEVILMPNTNYVVSNWYKGDVIALGQENVRNSAFKLKDEDIKRSLETNCALIIELKEIN